MMETQDLKFRESAEKPVFGKSNAEPVQMDEGAAVERSHAAAGDPSASGLSPSPAQAAPVMAHWVEGAPVQLSGAGAASVHELAGQGISGGGGALPFADQIQASFGRHDVSHVQAHVGGAAEAATRQMGAEAYATGNHIAFARSPDLHTAAHEAAHVVQQRGGVQLQDGVGKSGDVYEQHADAVADRVVRGESAEDLLDPMVGLAHAGPSVQKKPKKSVGAKAGGRLQKARDAIKHTKDVLKFGAGNQYDALKATNFNSYFRLEVMRDLSYWEIADSVRPIAAANPEALTAAMADLAAGGNCGEHAQIAFDYLRVHAQGETIHMADKEGLDHAFVLLGDVTSDSDGDITVSDPWPTAPTACLWEDHFAFTADRKQLNTRSSMVADGQNIKAVIARGLKLTPEGQARIQARLSDEQTDKELKRGTDRASGKNWIWRHASTTAPGRDYDYQTR